MDYMEVDGNQLRGEERARNRVGKEVRNISLGTFVRMSLGLGTTSQDVINE